MDNTVFSKFIIEDPREISNVEGGDKDENEDEDVKVNEGNKKIYYIIEDPLILDGEDELEMKISSSYNEIEQKVENHIININQIAVEDSFSEMNVTNPSDYKVLSNIHVVLDCANIGWQYGDRKRFNAIGVSKAIYYFQLNGCKITAFLPMNMVKKKPSNGKGNSLMETEEFDILNSFVEDGILTLVPSGDYDDHYILHYARENAAFIISNDFFMDHLAELTIKSIKNSMQIYLNNNRCGYTFVNNEFMINPNGNLFKTIINIQDIVKYEICNDQDNSMKSNNAIIESLTQTIEVLILNNKIFELKFLLIARSHAYFEINSFVQALTDAELIIQNIDSNCIDAIELKRLCLLYI